MKKLLVSIFAVFYLGLSSGAVVHLHYCMDQLVEWNLLNDSNNDLCGNCGMPKTHKKDKKDCCREDVQFIKITDAQKTTDNINPAHLNFTAVPVPSFFETVIINIPGTVQNDSFTPPPLVHGPGIYLRNCVFRI